MNCKEILIYVVMPIVSALIGGGLTLVGVLFTMKFEAQKIKEERKATNKPLFYVIDPMQQYDNNNSGNFDFVNEKIGTSHGFITIIFKNTDKTILVLDYISINNVKYYSKNGNIVDKNTVFNTYVHIPSGEKVDYTSNIVFSIKDSIGNNYKYKLSYKDKKSNYITQFEEL